MNIMADSESTTEEEQQLQKQLENIYLDYQKTLESSQSMAPKDINTRKIGTANNGDEVDDDDLEGLCCKKIALENRNSHNQYRFMKY